LYLVLPFSRLTFTQSISSLLIGAISIAVILFVELRQVLRAFMVGLMDISPCVAVAPLAACFFEWNSVKDDEARTTSFFLLKEVAAQLGMAV
jgi:hypothetical protein